MTIAVFLGPSLALKDASKLLEAVYLPPAGQGDVYRAVRDYQPDRIALIDGFFEQVPAVWHKEILWALQQGVAVYGAASMGALRAAELAPFGMIGVGTVFEAYQSGRFPGFDDEPFEDDDEVAVAHGPAELGYIGSEAMVDIRATLLAAEKQGVIDKTCRDRLAALAKGVFYKDRRFDHVLRSAHSEAALQPALSAFEAWLPNGRVSQKRRDAKTLLERLALGRDEPNIPAFRFETTSVWEAALRAMDEVD